MYICRTIDKARRCFMYKPVESSFSSYLQWNQADMRRFLPPNGNQPVRRKARNITYWIPPRGRRRDGEAETAGV